VLVFTIVETKVQGEDVAETLRQEMLAAVDRAGIFKVVVDFRNVRYISSAAFRPLLSLRRRVQEAGGQIILCGLTNVVGDIFHATRMIDPSGSVRTMFEIEPTVAAAVARLTLPPAQN
jgi:anti-sigma B factor antagonist